MITLANAWIVALGALLLAIPIVLHLLMQPKPKVLSFPALRFVREREVTNRSRLRFRHFLLLFLRCLVILILALALAGPAVASAQFGQWLTLGGILALALLVAVLLAAAWWLATRRNTALISILAALLVALLGYAAYLGAAIASGSENVVLGDSRAPVAALIVVDTSPRMEYLREDRTNLDRAREMGDWIGSQLPPDSQVCVLATDGDDPFFSVDVGAARQRIAALETVFLTSSIPETLRRGMKTLDESELERKEVYVITDLTRAGWTDDAAGDLKKVLDDREDVALFVIDVGTEQPSNFQLGSLELDRTTITTDGAFEIDTSVNRLGEAAQRNVRMKIEKPDPQGIRPVIRDGRVLVPEEYWEMTETVDVRADQSSPVHFRFSGQLPEGTHHGQVEIVGADALPVDDVRYFTVEVRRAWEVLVVHAPDVTPYNLTDLLAPIQEQERGSVAYKPTVIRQDELGQHDLADFDGVFFLDPNPLPEAIWEELARYVAGGGGVAFFLGHNAATSGGEPDPSFQTEAAARLLTGRLVRQWNRQTPDLFLSPENLSHPILQPFRRIQEAVPWQNHPVYKFWEIGADDQEESLPTQTVLAYGNGLPAIRVRQIDLGRVVVMTTPITEPVRPEGRRPWNELFVGYCWPAWMLVDSISEFVVQNTGDTLNLTVGQPARIRNDVRKWPDTYRVFAPNTTETPTAVQAVDNVVRYRFTNVPGHYRLKGRRGGVVLRGFSVNLDPAATDLSRIAPSELDDVLGFENYQLAKQKEDLQRQQGTVRRGQEFYPLLAMMLVLLLGMEFLMSNRFYSN